MTEPKGERELMELLIKTIAELGWSVAIPDVDPEQDIQGMIIGSDEYIDKIMACLPEKLFES